MRNNDKRERLFEQLLYNLEYAGDETRADLHREMHCEAMVNYIKQFLEQEHTTVGVGTLTAHLVGVVSDDQIKAVNEATLATLEMARDNMNKVLTAYGGVDHQRMTEEAQLLHATLTELERFVETGGTDVKLS